MTCLVRKIDPSDMAQLIEIEKIYTSIFKYSQVILACRKSRIVFQSHLQLISSLTICRD